VEDKIQEWMDFAQRRCDTNIRIEYFWNNRFTSRMGDAKWNKARGFGEVRLSAPLWPYASEREQRITVIHEVCHVIAWYQRGKRQGHNWYWGHLMNLCGLPAERCHCVPRPDHLKRKRKRKPKQIVYCDCGERTIGPTRYKRMVSGQTTYTCTICNGPITLNPLVF
jgi:predicted SprT family Zn-dependent metalloprotease